MLNSGMHEIKAGDRLWHDSIYGRVDFTVLDTRIVPWSGYVELGLYDVPGAARVGFHFEDAGLLQQALRVRYDTPGIHGSTDDVIYSRDFRGCERFAKQLADSEAPKHSDSRT